jgi:curli biogenesis system outer membrane secretion channel CsgG
MVSEGVNDTKDATNVLKKSNRFREWERSQTNDLLGRDELDSQDNNAHGAALCALLHCGNTVA